ncbi:MAG: hypothetical protein LUQ38_11660 [Methanotrichaceae archaeon]|nr:hypothetical protein [Methanotrichaceae archaeon]MDD1757942.1 hypothetical protein [Methanotrichaceae archaeon]
MRQAAHEATVLLCSSGIDPFLEELAKDADRVFYLRKRTERHAGPSAKIWLKMKYQKTLEAFL